MILLSDASVLIDLGYVGALGMLPRIAPTEVLDVVLQECEDRRQPGLVDAVRAAGVREIAVQAAWVVSSHAYRSAELSLQDRLSRYYAKAHRRRLLATDAPLRARCVREGVEVHGTLWLIEEANRRSLAEPSDFCRWIATWQRRGSRLPLPDVRRIERLLGC